jgi:hypothetical protein
LLANHGGPLGAKSNLSKPRAAKKLLQHAPHIYEPLNGFLEHYQKHIISILVIKPYPVDITNVDSRMAVCASDSKPTKRLHKRLRSIFRQFDQLFAKDPWFPG